LGFPRSWWYDHGYDQDRGHDYERQEFKSLLTSSSLKDPNQHHNDGDDQQDMNKITHRIATNSQKITSTTAIVHNM